MTAQVTSDHHGNNEADVEGMLSKHNEFKTEIDTMHKNVENLHTCGESLISGQHYAAEMVRRKLDELRTGWTILLKSSEDRTEELQRRKKAENMNREVTQLEAWLMNQEAELSLNEVGNCLENVEDLLKKHDEMERMLHAQEERFLSLVQASDDGQGYNVATESVPNQETEASAIEHVHDLRDRSSNNNDTAEISKMSELNSISNPVENINDSTGRSLASDDFSTSNNNYDVAEMSKVSELNSMPNFNLEGDTKVSDESTNTNSFSGRIRKNSQKNLYKEPMSASERILGVSPLCSGILQRKQETDISGQRSVAQPWRSYYTVLSEDILQFFKDHEGFKSKWHVSKPMSLVGAFCEQVRESSRQGYIFRVVFRDKSEYLFATENEEECKLWVGKINSVIKMAARYSSGGEGDDDGSDGDSDGADHDISDGIPSDNGGDGGCNRQIYLGDNDCASDGDSSGRANSGDIDSDTNPDYDGRINISDKTSNDFKEPHHNDTPMIIITDTNSNNEFLVEDDVYKDTHSSSEDDAHLSDEHIRLSDEDTMSLPEYSDYEQPSWYPTPNSDLLDHNGAYPLSEFSVQDNGSNQDISELDDTLHETMDKSLIDVSHVEDSFETPPPIPNSSPPSPPDIDSIAPPRKPSTRVFKAKENRYREEHDLPPPVPSTPPPSIPTSDIESNLPPDLPETFPPEATDDNVSDLLDFIPPPVLDPSFDFLIEAKSEMEVKESASPNEAKLVSTTRPLSETKIDSSSRFTPRRIAPPPPPRPSVSLLSDMDLPISIQTARKQHERKDEKKGLFSGIFKRKK